MQSRRIISVGLPALVLATVAFWIGCDQRGEVSPTSAGRTLLTYIDTLIVEPPVVAPGGAAAIRARILNERHQPAGHEPVRFSVSGGSLNGAGPAVTLPSDTFGWARATWTAPADSGSIVLQTDLLTMGERRTTLLRVRGADTPEGEGLLTCWAEEDTLFADNGASTTLIYARLRNANNNPVGGVEIEFSTSFGSVTSPGLTDDISGTATAVLTSTTEAGVAVVTARYGGVSDTARVAFLTPASAGSIVVSAGRSQLTAGIDSTSITAYVLDTNGQPILDNTVVFFGTTAGALRQVTARTRDGIAVTMLRAAPTVGEAIVSATTGGSVTGSTTVRTVPGPTGAMTLTSSSDTLFADNSSEATIRAFVTDAFGNPVAQGTPLDFSAEGGTVTGNAIVGPDGYATAIFRAGLVTGPAAVNAEQGGVNASIPIYLRPTIAALLNFTVNPLRMPANGTDQASLRALVLDEQGRPVSDGTLVTFTSQVGVLTGAPGSAFKAGGKSGTLWKTDYDLKHRRDAQAPPEATRLWQGGRPTQSLFSTTTEGGYAYAMLTSPTRTGSDTVSAAVQELLERQVEQYVPGPAAAIEVAPADAELPADGRSSTPVICTVTDAFGNSVGSGVAVQFSASLGDVLPGAAVTDANGMVATTLYSERERGMCVVSATAAGATGYGQINFVAPAVAAVALAGDRPALLADGVSMMLLTAVAVDAYGLPVEGAAVVWTAQPGPGSLWVEDLYTDSTGRADAYFESAALGSDADRVVSAAVGGQSADHTVRMLGVTVSAWSSVAELPADGNSTCDFYVHVREATSGIAVTNATVRLSASLGTIPQTAQTDASGVATALYRSSNQPGDVTVTAYYGDTLRATGSLRLNSTQADTVIVTLGQEIIHADGASTMPVTAVAYNSQGQPVPNTLVSFTAVGGGICIPAQATTNAQGVALTTYRSAASADDQVVQIDAAIERDNDSKPVLLRGVTVDVTATPATIVADGISTSEIRAHIYETSTSVAISGVPVTFGATLGTIPNSANTNASGIATVTLTAGTSTGASSVSALYGNLLQDNVSVTFVPSTPTTLSLSAQPTVLLADNAATSTITAILTDQNGNPVPNGTAVRFSIPPQGGSLEYLRQTQGGAAVNILTSSTTPDTVQVTAWADANPAARDSVTIIYVVGDPAVVTMSAQSDTLRADGIATDTITARVTDAVGHPLANVEVTFNASVGNIPASRVTDQDGYARATFSSSQTGTAQITATAGEVSGTYTIYLIPGGPNSISLEYFPNSVGVRGSGRNETLLITATVRDVNNNPVVDGTPVYFGLVGSPGGGDYLSSTGPITTINGRATVSYSSGTRSGSVRIRANCESVSAVSTEILIYAGPPFIEDVALGCETSHMSAAASPCNMFGMDVVGDSVVVTVLVGDRYNNPVTPGTAVYFSTSGGVITTNTGYTDANGFARVTLYSGNPLPTVDRWLNTLVDPNLGTPTFCTAQPPRSGIAKVMATSAGVDAAGDSVTVWSTTDVTFNYSQPLLYIREASVNGDPTERDLYIGQNALIRLAAYDPNFWPLVYGSTITFSSSTGMIYPDEITVGCPSDTSFTVSFFNDLSTTDEDAASPVLITVDTRYGDTFAFTETFTLWADFPSVP